MVGTCRGILQYRQEQQLGGAWPATATSACSRSAGLTGAHSIHLPGHCGGRRAAGCERGHGGAAGPRRSAGESSWRVCRAVMCCASAVNLCAGSSHEKDMKHNPKVGLEAQPGTPCLDASPQVLQGRISVGALLAGALRCAALRGWGHQNGGTPGAVGLDAAAGDIWCRAGGRPPCICLPPHPFATCPFPPPPQ